MNKQLLIIDDEEGICFGLKELLGDNYDVVLAGSAEEAWERIVSKGDCVDLIITDMVLPETDGLEFLKKLWKINRHIPAIVITGSPVYVEALKESYPGYCVCMSKPFDIDLLLKNIRETLTVSERMENTERPPCLLQR